MTDALGDRIARLRHKAGLSQAALADRLGLSSSAVGMYEQGRREPPLDTIVLMSMVFGVTTDYLLTGHIRTDRDFAVATDCNRKKYWQLIVTLPAENGGDM